MTTCTTLPALAAPSNAQSCPPEGSTSPGIARRAILARTAAALGLGAAANVMAVVATRSAPTDASADPIFAALDAHRAVWKTVQEEIRRADQRETELRKANLRVRDDVGWLEYQELVGSAWDDHHDAAVDLLNTLPTTIAGVVALLDYAVEFAIAYQDCWPDKMPGWSEEGDRDDEQPFEIWLLNSVSLALSAIAERGGEAS